MLKHRLSHTRLHNIWIGMKNRCYNKRNTKFKHYGGRGITVCDEWQTNFLAFKTWAENNGYRADLTIERINVNGQYCPENCKWVDRVAQANNRRSNVYYRGKTLAQWCRELGLPYKTIFNRIRILNWDFEKAISTPIRNAS